MALVAGTAIAQYSILSPLGAGGMGEVYRARDAKLQRDVAIKVLPAAVAGDQERLARFEREAHVLAALNHPNIAAIYGVVDAGGVSALVLELVEGQTLAERLEEGAIPPPEAVAIARQIAAALEAAHDAGVVHRDLKPANIKLRPDGTVKVLDFGLAKARSGAVSGVLAPEMTDSPTALPGGTGAGVILGTAAYMAPEQARGRGVDKRADIWAFGVVLWEMLTGQSLFQGETISDTLAAVLTRVVDWARLPPSTPPALVDVLRRCLERDPRRRLRDIGDARLDEAALVEAGPLAHHGRRTWWPLAATGVAALAAGILGGLLAGRQAAPAAGVPAPNEVRFTFTVPDAGSAAISADGSSVVVASNGPLRVRDLKSLDARELSGTDGALRPFWSPDGRTIGFGRAGRLWRVSAAGGAPVAICDLPNGYWDHDAGGAWLPDDTIIFTTGGSGLFRVGAAGGDAASYVAADQADDLHFHGVESLPGGVGLLYVLHRRGGADTIELFANGRRTTLLQVPGQTVHNPVYSPTGHILFSRSPTNEGLWALPFSLDRLSVAGEAYLVEGGAGSPSTSTNGTLLYMPRPEHAESRLRWFARDGTPGEALGEPGQFERFPSLSPDGARVAICERLDGTWGITVLDLSRGTRQRLVTDGRPSAPSWLPDGRGLLYTVALPAAQGTVINRVSLDGARTDRLAAGARPVTIDGRRYFFERFANNDFDILVAPLAGGGEQTFLGGPTADVAPQPSPDGSMIAYMSMPSLVRGRPEVMLRRLASSEDRWQVSSGGGSWPRWSANGRAISYVTADAFFEVGVAVTDGGVELSPPRRLFTRKAPITVWGPDAFDVAKDGRLLILDPVDGAADRPIHVVLHWSPRRAPV